MALYAMEPRGEERGDLQAAIVASAVVNASRDRSRGPVSVADFLPSFEEDELPPDEQKTALLQWWSQRQSGRR